MRKKLIVICIVVVFLIVVSVPVFVHFTKTQSFISKIEENTAINEEDKSEILEFYNDPNISNDDKEELAQLIEEYPEIFDSRKDFQDEEDNFNMVISDYEVVVQNVITYIDSKQCEQPFCITIYEKDNKAILSGLDEEYGVFELDISIYESMKRIESSFSEMGYTFSIIRIVEDTICFNTIDGRYSLMYTLDGISPEEKGLDVSRNREYKITHINGNWYHSLFDKYI